MNQVPQGEPQTVRESLKDFLVAESRTRQQPFCIHCGQLMQYMDATFWLQGDESGFNLRIPICPCQPASAHSADWRSAAHNTSW